MIDNLLADLRAIGVSVAVIGCICALAAVVALVVSVR